MWPDNSNPSAASSFHPGVVQFCFADGHVRPLRHGNTAWNGVNPLPPESSDWWVFLELGGFRDGGVRDTSRLVP
jgi:prepilin-type processing-associated H-X9-DG protein